MQTTAIVLYAFSAALVLYVFVGYAAVLAIVAKLRSRAPRLQVGFSASVSFVTCARNEQKQIGRRVNELAALLEDANIGGEVIVVSDGSTDGTAALARQQAGQVHVIELAQRQGKAAALSAGCAAAVNDILVFADCRQRWDKQSLRLLLENFADPDVGAVSGDLVLESAPGVMAGVGSYWRYEKWLRKKESRIHSTVGVTGAICAVRRQLFPGVPSGMVLDDVYWPLRVAMAGHRVVHDHRALAFDLLPDRAIDEFRRKVRTLAGNFQIVAHMPHVLLPWRNPVWWQFASHKLLRLALPWAFMAMLATTMLLPGLFCWLMLVGQVLFYGLALVGNIPAVGRRFRLAAAAASVLVLVAAAGMAFFVWAAGRTGQTWRPTAYKGSPASLPPLTAYAGIKD